MTHRVKKIVWTRQAKEALVDVLEYRYAELPSAYNIVQKDILAASKRIVFPEQYQEDEIYPGFRRIIVRDYKLLYTHKDGVISIIDVICTRAGVK